MSLLRDFIKKVVPKADAAKAKSPTGIIDPFAEEAKTPKSPKVQDTGKAKSHGGIIDPFAEEAKTPKSPKAQDTGKAKSSGGIIDPFAEEAKTPKTPKVHDTGKAKSPGGIIDPFAEEAKTPKTPKQTDAVKPPSTGGLIDPFAPGASKLKAPKTPGKGAAAPALRIIMIFPAEKVTLKDGELMPFTARGLFSAGPDQDVTKKVEWSSSNAKVVSIDKDGLATGGTAAGTAKITAKDAASGVNASVEVTAAPRVMQKIMLHAGPTLAFGGQWQFKAEGMYADDSTQDITSRIAWSSSDKAIVTVDASGLATAGAKAGVATIYLKDKVTGLSREGIVYVTSDGEPMEPDYRSLKIHPARAKVIGGWRQQFQAFGKSSLLKKATEVRNVVWSSSAPDLLSINEKGLAEAQKKSGTATITATHKKSGTSVSTKVTVTWDGANPQAPPLKLIRLTNPGSIAIGERKHFKAEGIYADKSEQDLTYEIDWSSSDTDIVTMDQNGRATAGSKAGTAKVTATDKATGVTTHGMVNVVAPGAE